MSKPESREDNNQVSRRDFVSRAAAIGLSAAAAGSLLGSGDVLAAATDKSKKSKTSKVTGNLTIAYQPGIGYAQLVMAKHLRLLERQMPHVSVQYNLLASGAAIRDGMLAGQIQVGSGGTGPFLVGWAAGVDWRILSSLNQMDLWLMVKDPKIKSLKDFKPEDKIAMPAPDSIQAVVLRKGALKELGNAHALDTNIVSMAHPDGLQALLSGQIAGHLTSPPFQFQEEANGAHRILNSYSLFGQSTFNSVFVLRNFHDANPEMMRILYNTVASMSDLIRRKPAMAARILSEDTGGKTSAKDFEGWITHHGVKYTVVPHGLMEYAIFMKQISLINKVPGSWKTLVFDNLKHARGS